MTSVYPTEMSRTSGSWYVVYCWHSHVDRGILVEMLLSESWCVSSETMKSLLPWFLLVALLPLIEMRAHEYRKLRSAGR